MAEEQKPEKNYTEMRKTSTISTYKVKGRDAISSLKQGLLRYLRSQGFELKKWGSGRGGLEYFIDTNNKETSEGICDVSGFPDMEKASGWVGDCLPSFSEFEVPWIKFKIKSNTRLEQVMDEYIAQQPKEEVAEAQPVGEGE